MNQINAVVCEIIEEPYQKYNKFWQAVKYISYGVEGKTVLMFDSLEDCKKVKKGYQFLI